VTRDDEGFIQVPQYDLFAQKAGNSAVEDIKKLVNEGAPKSDVLDKLDELLKINKFLDLFDIKVDDVPFPWRSAHRSNAKAAVHSLTLMKDNKGQSQVFLLVTHRPPLGGDQKDSVYTIETPAGIWGDQDVEEKHWKLPTVKS